MDAPPHFCQIPAWTLRGTATVLRPFNVNASTFLDLFALMGQRDAVGPPTGPHHLIDTFDEATSARVD